MTIRTVIESVRIASDHPSLSGHFPGYPIVPAVVILDHLMSAVLRTKQGKRVSKIRSAKFIEPVLPDIVLDIGIELSGSTAKFECRTEGKLKITGQVELTDL